MRIITAALLLISAALYSSAGHAEIHRCTDADGNMVFSQFPCAEEPAVPKDDEPSEEAEAVETDDTRPADQDVDAAARVRDPRAVAQCKQPYRDAIDAIEARMLDGYTPDQGAAYKKQLLGLTQGMRRCET